MRTIKIKITAEDSAVIGKIIMINVFDLPNHLSFPWLTAHAALIEIREAIADSLIKNRNKLALDSKRLISIHLPHSLAIVFFGMFNGTLEPAIAVMCEQIEQALFKSGIYPLPERGGYHG